MHQHLVAIDPGFASLDEHPVLDLNERAVLMHVVRSAAAAEETKRLWLLECERARLELERSGDTSRLVMVVA